MACNSRIENEVWRAPTSPAASVVVDRMLLHAMMKAVRVQGCQEAEKAEVQVKKYLKC